jgi:hypothetical protein
MKKLSIITVLSAAALIVSCSDVKRTPGHVYMPDMATSRAYETYADHSNLAEKGINYNNMPVTGTIARGEEMPFHLAKDATGDSTNYVASKQVKSPIGSMSKGPGRSRKVVPHQLRYLPRKNLDGNGPLYNDGKGPYPVAPKNLKGDAVVSVMPEGQMFYSATYGKGSMGSYASQLDRKTALDGDQVYQNTAAGRESTRRNTSNNKSGANR